MDQAYAPMDTIILSSCISVLWHPCHRQVRAADQGREFQMRPVPERKHLSHIASKPKPFPLVLMAAQDWVAGCTGPGVFHIAFGL